MQNFKILVNKNTYVKDPESSDLGQKIIQESIILIDEIGFEAFTFKKLGERIQSNESSIYRYFENKHMLLVYLSSWYWSWINYKLVFATTNISNPIEKLEKSISIVTKTVFDENLTTYINEEILNRIIIYEFTKTFLTKEIDEENKKGYFLIYKSVVNKISGFIDEVNPNYLYAKSLATLIVEGSLHQHFIRNHFKSITSFNDVENESITLFFIDLVKKTIL